MRKAKSATEQEAPDAGATVSTSGPLWLDTPALAVPWLSAAILMRSMARHLCGHEVMSVGAKKGCGIG